MKNLPIKEFLSFIAENDLFDPQDRILVAVSGGKDSVFMAHLFSRTKIKFAIAHCNFMLRGEESEQDKEFVKALARNLNVSFYTENFLTTQVAAKRGISTQMAARDLRYAWFEEIRASRGFDKIAIAQHQTDVTETILMNLVRGTGISGLHGILPKRGTIIRPLLFLNEDSIKKHISRCRIPFREDESNKSLHYRRNAIRHQVLPVLKELNPALDETFMANARRILAAETMLSSYKETLRKTLFIPDGDKIKMSVHDLARINDPFELFEVLSPYGFNVGVLQDLLKSFKNPGKKFFSETHMIVTDRDYIYLSEKNYPTEQLELIENLPMEVDFYQQRYRLYLSEDLKLPSPASTVKLDASRLVLPLTLRTWTAGDSFQPLGMKGRKKVSDFFIQLKIPDIKKATIPLLVNGDQNILSVGTRRISEAYKVTINTKKVLIFERL